MARYVLANPCITMLTLRLDAAGTAIAAAACASSSSPLRPTRDARISDLSETTCESYGATGAACPGYGTAAGQKYQTETDCKRDLAKMAGVLWPADKCGGGRINPDRYMTCESNAEALAYSTGATSLIDANSAIDGCQSSKV